jgi:hypothetical protein
VGSGEGVPHLPLRSRQAPPPWSTRSWIEINKVITPRPGLRIVDLGHEDVRSGLSRIRTGGLLRVRETS